MLLPTTSIFGYALNDVSPVLELFAIHVLYAFLSQTYRCQLFIQIVAIGDLHFDFVW